MPLKILAIQFKYLGDAALMIPALRAVRGHFPDCELHALVPEEVGPLLEHLPWLTRLWPMRRQRGRARFRESWGVIRALRRERFDRSVDFAGNDRGAILSLLSGARERLGMSQPGGFLGRSLCYTHRAPQAPLDRHETLRLMHILSAWGVLMPDPAVGEGGIMEGRRDQGIVHGDHERGGDALPRVRPTGRSAPPAGFVESEIHTGAEQDQVAAGILPEGKILCHIASSQPKKEWPAERWAQFYSLATASGFDPVFSTGLGQREQSLLTELRTLVPDAPVLQPMPDLRLYLAVLKRARAFVSGDTGPLHCAAGVGVPTLSLFGPSEALRWAPLGQRHRSIQGPACHCDPCAAVCSHSAPCMAGISPETVLQSLRELTAGEKVAR